MKNIFIIGCGLLGSSLLRALVKKNISKKIFVFEKSKKNLNKIKKLKLSCVVVDDFKFAITNSDLIILCTPMSEYKKIVLKMNKYLTAKNLITDVTSVIKFLAVKYLFIFKTIFLYSLIGVHKMMRSEFVTANLKSSTTSQDSLSFFILFKFDLDFS